MEGSMVAFVTFLMSTSHGGLMFKRVGLLQAFYSLTAHPRVALHGTSCSTISCLVFKIAHSRLQVYRSILLTIEYEGMKQESLCSIQS